MTTILLSIVIFLQIVSISLSFIRKFPSLELLKKDFLIFEKNMEIMRSQMILITTKSNLDANRIALLESIILKQTKTNKTDIKFH